MNTFATVNGDVSIQTTGRILPHEHLIYYPLRLDPKYFDEIKAHYIPMYRRLVNEFRCDTIVEVMPRLIADVSGRYRDPDSYRRNNVELYQEICRESGMNLVLCTGFYREHTRPDYFFEKSVSELADEMIRDLVEQIDETGVRAGIIKVAVDDIHSPADRKLLAAAAIAQKATGVCITTHTCGRDVRFGTLNYLEGAGVNPERICIGHADTGSDIGEILALADRGCNMILTLWGITDRSTIGGRGIQPPLFSAYLTRALVDQGYIDQVMLSVDYAARHIDGGISPDLYNIPDRNSCYAFTFAVPALKSLGLSSEQIDKMMIDNPRKMLTRR